MRIAATACVIAAMTTATAWGQSLQEQEICAKQAKIAFQEYNEEQQRLSGPDYRQMGSDYQNHYNTKLNKCFIFIQSTVEDHVSRRTTTTDILMDAFERSVYASYFKNFPLPDTCLLTPSSRETRDCSGAEFDAFVAKYMEDQ
jgi:hypothetical protein